MSIGNSNNEWGLNEKEMMFALEYFETQNATQSYLKAYGGSYYSARTLGHQLRKRPTVAKFIEQLFDKITNDRIMTTEEVLIGLSDIARGNDTEQAQHQKIYAKDKVRALELLAKHYALLTEVQKQQLEHKVVIVDDMAEGELNEEE